MAIDPKLPSLLQFEVKSVDYYSLASLTRKANKHLQTMNSDKAMIVQAANYNNIFKCTVLDTFKYHLPCHVSISNINGGVNNCDDVIEILYSTQFYSLLLLLQIN